MHKNTFAQILFRSLIFGAVSGVFSLSLEAQTSPNLTISKEQIIAEGDKMADAQLAKLAGKKPDIEWVAGVMWAGYGDFSHLSAKTACTDAINQLGDSVKWSPLFSAKAPVHADDLCICQTFLDAYVSNPDPSRIAPTQRRMDLLCEAIEKGGPSDSRGPKGNQLTWWWCDALFMVPASMARISTITKDSKYVDAMDKEWWQTADVLYDKDEHLFYRDTHYLDKKASNGQKVFWSRGNGWVFAGLARMLTYLPANYPTRSKYITVFKDMAAKIASVQQADGSWHASLLDANQIPTPEMSGTALDCFAFAWGINNGILDRTTYLPVATKAWSALLAARQPDGVLGYVQPVGAAPGALKPENENLYATGAFLMSVCELAKLAPISIPAAPQPGISPK